MLSGKHHHVLYLEAAVETLEGKRGTFGVQRDYKGCVMQSV